MSSFIVKYIETIRDYKIVSITLADMNTTQFVNLKDFMDNFLKMKGAPIIIGICGGDVE